MQCKDIRMHKNQKFTQSMSHIRGGEILKVLKVFIKMETRIFKIDEKMTEIKMFQKLLFAVEIDQMFTKVYFIYDLQLLSQKWFCYSMVVTKLAFHTT